MIALQHPQKRSHPNTPKAIPTERFAIALPKPPLLNELLAAALRYRTPTSPKNDSYGALRYRTPQTPNFKPSQFQLIPKWRFLRSASLSLV
ncbi:MAG: hypothetical protein ACKPER_22225 [Dolichospermum sp.]